MLEENKLLLELNFRLATILNSLPFHLDPQTFRLYLPTNFSQRQKAITRKYYFGLFLISLLAAQTIWDRNLDLETTILSLLTISTLLFFYAVAVNTARWKAPEIVKYFNDITTFNSKYQTVIPNAGGKRKLSLMEKMNILFAVGALITAILLPTSFVYGLHWKDPCRPSLAGYFLLAECRGVCRSPQTPLFWIWSDEVLKHSIFLLNFLVWTFGVNCTLAVLTIFLMLGAINLRNAVELFGMTSTSAENRCIPLWRRILMYRHIQVLDCLCNDISAVLITLVLQSASGAVAMGLFMTVKCLQNYDTLTYAIFLFGMITVDGTSVILVSMGGLASVYTASKAGFEQGRRSLRNRREEDKFLRSCPYIRISFLGSYFLDEETPLKTLNIAINLGVNLLLLEDRH